MHLGDFLYLPDRDSIHDDPIKHETRNKGMFGHPVVLVKINRDENRVYFRSVTTSKDKDDETGRQARMQTRVCIVPKRGYTEVESRNLYNEHQMDESYCLHKDSADLRKPSEILITEGLIFKVKPQTLLPLGWAKGNRVYLDVDSTNRLVWECPKVYGPGSSLRRGSSSSDSGSSTLSSSGSTSPPTTQRSILAERNVNITSLTTANKSELIKGMWR